MYFDNFVIVSPRIGWGPSFEQTWILLTQGWFVPSLVEIGQAVSWEEYFKKLSIYFHYFEIISPLEREWPFIWNPFIQGCFVPSLVKIGPMVLEKKSKMGKVNRQTDRHPDRRHAIIKAH